jgi:hypothetical protein
MTVPAPPVEARAVIADNTNWTSSALQVVPSYKVRFASGMLTPRGQLKEQPPAAPPTAKKLLWVLAGSAFRDFSTDGKTGGTAGLSKVCQYNWLHGGAAEILLGALQGYNSRAAAAEAAARQQQLPDLDAENFLLQIQMELELWNSGLEDEAEVNEALDQEKQTAQHLEETLAAIDIYFPQIRYTFTHYAALSGDIFEMSWDALDIFCKTCNLSEVGEAQRD